MTKPLENIRVLDLTRLLPGAICTLLLADMGADVIKVEDPGAGDYARHMPPLHDGVGAFYKASNRDKRSIVINLKDEAGQAAFHQLAQQADVVVEGFRPGVTQRLNVDYATLKASNPRLVYCSLSGWGQTGPYQHLSGHDLNYVSAFGVLGGMENAQALGAQIADVGGAYTGVMGILAALLKRGSTDEGDYIDVALAEGALPFALFNFVEAHMTNAPAGKGALSGGMAYYNVYSSSDGQPLSLGAIEPKFWANFCNAVQKPGWIALQNDLSQQATLRAALEALFASKTAAEWDALLADVDCCFTRVVPPKALADDPQIQARGMAGLADDGLPWMRSPVHFASADSSTHGAAPMQGEHTAQILTEFGFSPDDIATLQASGAVGKA